MEKNSGEFCFSRFSRLIEIYRRDRNIRSFFAVENLKILAFLCKPKSLYNLRRWNKCSELIEGEGEEGKKSSDLISEIT